MNQLGIKTNKGFTRTPKFGVTTKRGGFTLVETLVALFIFSVSVVVLIGVISSGITTTAGARDKMVAAYLAQEGVEYIRNMRDTYILYDPSGPNNGWNSFIQKVYPCEEESLGGCYFDGSLLNFGSGNQPIIDLPVIPCNDTCPLMHHDEATGRYDYTSAETSRFSRTIRIEISASEVLVISTVALDLPSGTYEIALSESLYNWLE